MRSILIVVALSLVVGTSAHAQYPTDMLFCFFGSLDICADVGGGDFLDFSCPTRAWTNYYGRVGFKILQYAGPITIEVDARRSSKSRFPVYIEWIPVEGRPQELGFCDGPGEVVAVVWGGTECYSPCEKFGPIPLRLEPGDRYALRAHWLGTETGQMTYVNCIRVTASTGLTAVESSTWGMVKRLYR